MDIATSLRFWDWTGFFGIGHMTYGPGQLEKEGPFTNPARMIEDIMGHDPGPMNPEKPEAGSESDFYARVWSHAGWWDKPLGRQ